MGDAGDSTNEAIVRAMWRAHRDGRIDAMLELLHPEIVWWPVSRPGRSRYDGHEGIRLMVVDARRAMGPYEIVLDAISETGPVNVTARGQVLRLGGAGEVLGLVEFRTVLRDGLVHRVEAIDLTPEPGCLTDPQ